MYLIKRDGRQEPVRFEKITDRIRTLCWGFSPLVDPIVVAQKVCAGVYTGVTTTELDELAAETAANLATIHPDYAHLAARIAVSNLHKNTKKNFFDVMTDLYTYVDPKSGKPGPLISPHVYEFMKKHQNDLTTAIIHRRDYNYDYFGFKTLERSYLFKLDGQVVERPQHMLMRVSCGIHCGDLAAALETYEYLSEKWFTHASPTLFNAGTNRPQLSSCFLVTMKSDSMEGIYDTLKTCALISKSAGGIGLAVHNIRASGSLIRGSNGQSNGLIPMLRVFNNTARYVDQGGKRKGAFAIYLEPWHPDILAWLDLRKNHGSEENRARDMFYGLWIPDLFMQRVEENGLWSLFCPDEAPGLADVWGDEFNRLYTMYENQGRARTVVKARSIWSAILESQQETGTPYMLYKDSCNRKSNQQNLGTIRSSNLCTEIIEYTAPDEVAVCNLASIAISRFVKEDKTFDFEKLITITKVVTKNLNRIIDINYYPVPEARYSNLKHRPIGLGVQGVADAFILLGLPYESEGAQLLNKQIFATIYYAALQASMELAREEGPYETYVGSPISKGILQYDMWNITKPETVNGLLDWDTLKQNIHTYGVRNSLLLAPMPTASTSQILANNESFEPYTSNLYVRRTLAGEFVCVNQHLLRTLAERGLWHPAMKDKLIANNGSVQNIPEIPDDIKELYKTVWEMRGRTLINMAADRGAYIDQSQSFNVHMENVNFTKLTSMHFYAWKKGLKTGMYYLRTKAAADAIKFTVDPTVLKNAAAEANSNPNTSTAMNVVKPTSMDNTGGSASATAASMPQRNSDTSAASVKSPKIPITPLPKAEREAETQASIEAWRAERAKKANSMKAAEDASGECTMCSG